MFPNVGAIDIRDTSTNSAALWEVKFVRRRMYWVVLNCGEYRKTSLLESERQTTGTSKEVYPDGLVIFHLVVPVF